MSRPNNTLSTRIMEELDVLPRIATERCMGKVHAELRDVNKMAYEPVLLAIGPYNDQDKVGHGFMKEHKLRYLQKMLERTKISVEDYIGALRSGLKARARGYLHAECISKTQSQSDAIVEMMLLDGCFIIELFHRYYKKGGRPKDDPIFQKKWVLPRIARDLLLFENQLPFFVLAILFEMSESNDPSNSEEHIVDIDTDQGTLKMRNRLIDRALGFFSGFLSALLPFKLNKVDNSTKTITDLLDLTLEASNPSLPVIICQRLELGFRFKNAEFEDLLGLIHATICISILDSEIDHAKECQEAGWSQMAKIFKHPFGLIGKAVTSLHAKKKPLVGASSTMEWTPAGASLIEEPLLGASLFEEPVLSGASLSKEPLAVAVAIGQVEFEERRVEEPLDAGFSGASIIQEPLVGASALFKVPLAVHAKGASVSEEPLVGLAEFVERRVEEPLDEGFSGCSKLSVEPPDDGFRRASVIQEPLVGAGALFKETVISAARLSQESRFPVDVREKWKHLVDVLQLKEAGVETTKASKFVSKLNEICRWIIIPYAIELQEAEIEFEKLPEIFYAHLHPDQNGNKEQKSKLSETGTLMTGVESMNAEVLKRLLCEAGVDINKVKKFERLREIEHRNIHGATELEEAGITFKKADKCDMFSIKLNNGQMEISPWSIVDETETCLRNLIAYEQYQDRENGFNYVDNFVCFMDNLINSPKDVELLRRSGIISNYLGDDEVISTMVNKLCDNITISPKSSIYARTSVDLNMYCDTTWNLWKAKLRHDYFNSPWALVSFLAAALLLLLSITQTVLSIIS
ncbi:hypothetical protein F2P56_015171 [Juglans regia]|uniref:Uncharacterized protein LOC109020108 n=2 Tax=Juglans regia TaxID=51240 RepID=A0A2I4HPK3_JUGRE|nr:uncharacterized protein LOC109020108 [Juglans regia]XP_018858058.1 uncharacterized protein LOC109020108 [Juglans regia]KAF5465140.1 hypothetical protein F2P56_015171 [Juglans regia]